MEEKVATHYIVSLQQGLCGIVRSLFLELLDLEPLVCSQQVELRL